MQQQKKYFARKQKQTPKGFPLQSTKQSQTNQVGLCRATLNTVGAVRP